jgi:hypothetical protein
MYKWGFEIAQQKKKWGFEKNKFWAALINDIFRYPNSLAEIDSKIDLRW